MSTDHHDAARRSLAALAVGDAFGSQFFVPGTRTHLAEHTLPPAPWQWTDDTEMACSVYRVLVEQGRVDQDALAASFAAHHDFDRGYGPATTRMLRQVREGGDWRDLAARLFEGRGSFGNGAAMRVAPLGAWFSTDTAVAAEQAARSATITHTHPEAVAGAVAVAVAAAVAARDGELKPGPFFDEVIAHVPRGLVHDGLGYARLLLTVRDPRTAAHHLGSGQRVSAQDTVPFTVWAAAKHLAVREGSFEAAMWDAVSGGGDADTTCAIIGGILGARLPPPPESWRSRVEALPAWSGA
ncbi:ADP-ribosylglycohydrolase [Murinocardiopsis flavida]|uniref:ADP-ribosylglycohydrolase n=1 Tax=Murinocardiopsis flavida TaxID=645275 RepID=A0A2P8DNZ1_9ACTN|nr:ADP-ribosylglycohydrolase family protein [Murinocardiopsis flavida]PSK98935.1 ADP-ribosylglycohydrolase [Murinocardiopsis flavida]